MFYDVFVKLCEDKGVTQNKACIESQTSRTSVAKWKAGAIPNGKTLNKLSEYFGVDVDYLLSGSEATGRPTDSDIKFALFDGEKGITEDMYDEVKAFARFVAERERKKQNEKPISDGRK